ncbi:MAG: ArnT family glycosyltransferase [Thermoanaerobaculia bacterium]
MRDATPRSLDPDSGTSTVSERLGPLRIAVLLLATVAFAAFHAWARAQTLWDWDEALFSLALRDFDIVRHNPHPPGFPLYVAMARAASFVVEGEFEALQAVNVVAAALLVPLAFFVGREAGFGFTTSVGGAALLAAFPNVVLFGAGAFSDVPSLALTLASVGLLLRGRSSRLAFIAGMLLAGAASSIRLQNLMICAVPAAIALLPRWRAKRRDVVVGFVLAATVIVASYGGDAVATGSWESYAGAVAEHAGYIARVDSWRGPDRASLIEVAELVFVRPFRAASLPGIISTLALLALLDLLVNRNRPTAIVAATFLPMMLFGLLMLDWHSMPRFAIAWMPFHALLAARGAAILAAMIRSWLRTPVTEVQWLLMAPLAFALVARTLPAIEILRTTDSPPIAAMRQVAASRDPARTKIWATEGSTSAMARLELSRFEIESVRHVEDVPLARDGSEAILVAEGNLYGAEEVFRRERKPFLGVERERFFEVSIVLVESMVQFGEGWHDPDEIIAPARRWMGAESRMVLGASGRERVATLQLRLPRETTGACNVEVSRDGELVAQLRPVEMGFDVEVALAAGDTPHEIAIRVDRTFRPSESEPGSTDERDLGLRLLGLDVR